LGLQYFTFRYEGKVSIKTEQRLYIVVLNHTPYTAEE